MKKLSHYSKKSACFCISLLFFYVSTATAADIGTIATTITASFAGLSKLITGGAVIAGLGFAMAGILKFKAHRDNPQQVPIGAPIALIFVAAALMFLPTVYESAGTTVFGTATKGQLTGTVIGQ